MTWQLVPFGDVFEIQLGKMLDKQKNVGELRPYLANRDVQWGKCDTSNLGVMRFSQADRQRFALQRGDLLVCEGGEVGRTAIWDGEVEDCYYQKAIHRLRPKLSIEPRFVVRYMRWAADRKLFAKLTSTTSIAHLTKAKLQQVSLPLPPLAEQKRIAAILDAADALRAKRRESLAQLDTLLQSTFLEMFGDPVTNPKGWDVLPLSSITDRVTDGTHQSPRWSESGIPFLFVSNIQDRSIDFSTSKYISEAEYDRLTARCPIEPGDILYTTVGSYGNPAVVREESGKFAFQRHIAHIKPKRNLVHSRFLEVMLDSPVGRRQADRLARGVAQKTLNLRELKSFEMLVPPRNEQLRFAKHVDLVERQKARLRAHLAELDTLFASLQFRAFNGQL